jgi:hypothetical protein
LLRARLRGVWEDAPGYQRLAYLVGVVLLATGLVHAGIWAVVGGSAQGPLSWRKPTTFGVSFGLTTLTLSWVATWLPVRRSTGWLARGKAPALDACGDVPAEQPTSTASWPRSGDEAALKPARAKVAACTAGRLAWRSRCEAMMKRAACKADAPMFSIVERVDLTRPCSASRNVS